MVVKAVRVKTGDEEVVEVEEITHPKAFSTASEEPRTATPGVRVAMEGKVVQAEMVGEEVPSL